MADHLNFRTYIPEPPRAEASSFSNHPEEQRRAALNNRRRVKRAKSKKLQRRRSEVVERSFAHLCETGGSRRSYLRGLIDVTKRYRIAAAAHNLGRILFRLTGVGKPRVLQKEGEEGSGGNGGPGRGSGLMSRFKSRLEWLWIATASHWADGDRPTVAARAALAA